MYKFALIAGDYRYVSFGDPTTEISESTYMYMGYSNLLLIWN